MEIYIMTCTHEWYQMMHYWWYPGKPELIELATVDMINCSQDNAIWEESRLGIGTFQKFWNDLRNMYFSPLYILIYRIIGVQKSTEVIQRTTVCFGHNTKLLKLYPLWSSEGYIRTSDFHHLKLWFGLKFLCLRNIHLVILELFIDPTTPSHTPTLSCQW